MKLNSEQQELFELWLADGNVSQFEPGMYSTQDAQYTNCINGMDDLKKYFVIEFCNETFERYCDATGIGMNKGYVVGEGDLYFSEEQHLIKWLKGVAEEESLNFESDKLIMNHYYEKELYYYTEWE